MKAKLLAGLFCFLLLLASPLPGADDPVPHPELYHAPVVPLGTLGLPLGTFAVIEGIEHPTPKFLGPYDFTVEKVNGKKPDHQLKIATEWPSQLPDKRVSGRRYVVHGYEAGKWEGQPNGLPKDEPDGWTQGGAFVFWHYFVVTSVEKIDDVTVADARPLDPKVPLAKPNFESMTVGKPPVGILGLPLGTFAIIEAHTPVQPPLQESPFAVDTVNGRHLDNPPVITIRDVPETKRNARVILHGFETGAWESNPDLPKSENPSGTEVQKPFQFFHRFVVTSPVKAGD